MATTAPGEEPVEHASPSASGRLLAELVESAPDAMVVVDDTGRIVLANRQSEALFGYDRSELVGSSVDLLVPEPLRGTHARDRAGYAETPAVRPMGISRTLYARRKDGSQVAVEISLAPLHVDDTIATAAVVRDVTERIRVQQELERQALHDALTGLPNRALVMEQLQRTLVRRSPSGRTAVVFLDVDRLKWVNDNLGHEEGDHLIIAIAERLRSALRPSDILGRFGGDEFVAVVDEVGERPDVVALAERLLAATRPPLQLSDHEVWPTVSIGVALADGQMGGHALVRAADAAMYRAKRNGRDRFELYEPETDDASRTDLDLYQALSTAVRSGTLPLHYQPVLDLRSGRLWGAEALVRWRTPEHGLLDAHQVIGLAERSSLILDLDRHVLHRACTDLAGLPEERVPRVGVNISSRHLSAGDLPELVRAALATSGVAPHRLWLELTESEQLTHSAVRAALDEVRELGVSIGLDDFGTGFSSLSRLRDLPVRLLKVDRGFTAALADDFRSEALLAAVIGLAHALGQDVVAEGIEEPEQLAALQRLGCDLGQGFYWAEAMSAGALAGWARG